MRKTVLLFLAFCITIINMANSYQDSITHHQISKDFITNLSKEELIQLSKDVKDIMYIKGIKREKHTDDKNNIVEMHLSSRKFVRGLIIAVMIFVILLISIPFYFNLMKTKSFHRFIEKIINKNKEIPDTILLSIHRTKSDLKKSIILIASGISVSIVLLIIKIDGGIWSIGLIPIVIGIGYFVVSRLENKS